MNTILILDDDEIFTQLLQTVLELDGYQPVVVPAPAALLPTVRQTDPAVVLMDVRFAEQQTFGVLQELRADSALAAVPVLMISGMDYEQESAAAGADAFLLKPFLPKELIRTIESLINRQDIGDNG